MLAELPADAVVAACAAWAQQGEGGRWWPAASDLAAMSRRQYLKRPDPAAAGSFRGPGSLSDYDLAKRAEMTRDAIDNAFNRVGSALGWPRGFCRVVETGLFRWPHMPEGAEVRDVQDLAQHNLGPTKQAPPPPHHLRGEQLQKARGEAALRVSERLT